MNSDQDRSSYDGRHEFDPGWTGMSVQCNALVTRLGDTDICDLPREAHVVEPEATEDLVVDFEGAPVKKLSLVTTSRGLTYAVEGGEVFRTDIPLPTGETAWDAHVRTALAIVGG